jgi:hypothetical protein
LRPCTERKSSHIGLGAGVDYDLTGLIVLGHKVDSTAWTDAMGKLDNGIGGEQVEFPKGVLYVNPFAVNLCLFAPAANGQQAFGGTLILVR